MKLFNVFKILILSLVVSITASAAQGGDVSGGGTLVTLNNKKELLDLYLGRQGQTYVPRLSGAPHKLPNSKAIERIHLDLLTNDNSALVQRALDLTHEWKQSSPVIAGIIEQALRGVPIYFTDYRIPVSDKSYYIPAEIPDSSLVLNTAAVYLKGLGAVISKKDLEELDEENQVALLIHESLRHVLLNYEMKISHKTVQWIVHTMITQDPRSATLDNVKILEGTLLDLVAGPEQARATVEKAQKEFCAAYEDVKTLLMPDLDRLIAQSCSETWLATRNYTDSVLALTEKFGEAVMKRFWDRDVAIHRAVDNARSVSSNVTIDLALMRISLTTASLLSATRELQDITNGIQLFNIGMRESIKDANESLFFLGSGARALGDLMEELRKAGMFSNQ